MNKYTYVLMMLVVFLIGGFLFINKDKSGDSLKIGAIIPLTGFGSYWGENNKIGIQVAQQELDKDFGPNKIKIIIEDSKSNPKDGVLAAQKLLGVDGVKSIYTEFSGVGAAVSELSKQEEFPMIYSAFNEKIQYENNLAYKTFLSYSNICESISSIAKERGYKKIKIISVIGDVSFFCKESILREVEDIQVEIVDNFTGKDFRTELLKSKKEKIDLILPVFYEEHYTPFLKQRKEMGIEIPIGCYGGDCNTKKIKKDIPNLFQVDDLFFDTVIKKRFSANLNENINLNINAIAFAHDALLLFANGSYLCERENREQFFAPCVLKSVNEQLLREQSGKTSKLAIVYTKNKEGKVYPKLIFFDFKGREIAIK